MSVPSFGFVLLFVENPLISSSFYSRLLRQKPLEESPTFALFALSHEVKLGLWSKKTAEPAVSALAGGAEIAFSYEEVDKLYTEWLALGIPMLQPPTDMDFGRTFVALDPDGHRIRVYKLWEEN